MSDFDKEAERERLREKYERDQEKREATEKMSDLLLKGATMTNAHCEQCGDPIFRYDGQEFCPTCEEVVTADAETGPEAEDAESASAEGTEDDPTAESTASDAPAGATNGDATASAGPDAASSEAGDRDATDEDAAAPGHIEIKRPAGSAANESANATARESDSAAGSEPDAGVETPDTGVRTGDPAGATGGAGGLDAARESLVRALVQQARQAEACDDPRRARDHLAAAREAAEALSALSS